MSDHEAPEQTPPNSIESEQAVLAGILVGGSAALVRVADMLKPAHFYRKAHAIIYDACVRMHGVEMPIDMVTVSNFLSDTEKLDVVGGRLFVSDLADSFFTNENLEYYASVVAERGILRSAWKAGQDLKPESREELLSAVADLTDLTQTGTRHTARDLSELLAEEYTAIEKRLEPGAEPETIDTGFGNLDALTNGLEPKTLVIVAGRPSMGKTTFAINLTERLAVGQQRAVAFFSLEMSQQQIRQKFLALRSGIPTTKIRRPAQWTQADWDKINIAQGEYSHATIQVVDEGVDVVMDVEAHIARMKVRPEIIVIDHLSYVEPSKEHSTRNDAVGEITKGLKRLAKKLNAVVILLCQLSRGVEGRQEKRPMLSDLRESGNIEQDADQVMFLYREEYYKPDTDRKGECELILAKNRMGEIGVCNFLAQLSTGVFTEFKRDQNGTVVPFVRDRKYGTGFTGHPFRDD